VLAEIALAVLIVSTVLVGADRLTLGLGGVARKLAVPPFIVGLSVAASVTSIPEMFISVSAAAQGLPGVGIKLVVGSNIFNSGFVLGVVLILANSKTLLSGDEIKIVFFAMVSITALVVGLFLDTFLSRVDGFVLAVAYVITITWALRLKRPGGPIYSQYDGTHGVNISTAACIRNAGVGISLIVVAIYATSFAARNYEALSGDFGGYVLFSALTSLPELYIGIVSILRREFRFAVGLVIGSNLINGTLCLGAVAIAQPSTLGPTVIALHAFVMVAFSLVLIAMLVELEEDVKNTVKLEGIALVIAYLSYAVYVASQNAPATT
jgi:cation:H+ antiporter